MHDFKKLQNKFGEGVNLMPYYLNIGDFFLIYTGFYMMGVTKESGVTKAEDILNLNQRVISCTFNSNDFIRRHIL